MRTACLVVVLSACNNTSNPPAAAPPDAAHAPDGPCRALTHRAPATINGPFKIDQLAMSEMKLTTRWTIHENDLNKPQVERTARFLITASLSTDGTKLELTIGGTHTDRHDQRRRDAAMTIVTRR